MRKVRIFFKNKFAGLLTEIKYGEIYQFEYIDDYNGEAISLTMPVEKKKYHYIQFPSFFDGLLPEGFQLEALLKEKKIDRNDYLSQLAAIGKDMVGAVTIEDYNE